MAAAPAAAAWMWGVGARAPEFGEISKRMASPCSRPLYSCTCVTFGQKIMFVCSLACLGPVVPLAQWQTLRAPPTHPNCLASCHKSTRLICSSDHSFSSWAHAQRVAPSPSKVGHYLRPRGHFPQNLPHHTLPQPSTAMGWPHRPNPWPDSDSETSKTQGGMGECEQSAG